jgi:type IV pilus assembly protein PilO
MASTGAMAELARLPPSRKALVFAVIGGVIGLGYWKLVYQSLDEQLDAVKAEHKAKLGTVDRLTKDLPKYDELRTHMTKLTEQIERNQAALPSEAEVPAFFETLQRKVAESGVEIRRWTNRGEEPVESFVKVPVEIELTGTFMQIKRFFASLTQRDIRLPQPAGHRPSDERERIVSIESLALGSPTVKNREMILTAKFTAVTFRQEDKPVVPDKPPNGQPAAAAKPPAPNPPAPPVPATPAPPPLPSSSSAPPLPSAATPAGAKARLDKALDQGDARNRNAGGVDEAKLPAGGSDRLKRGLQ